MRNVQTRAINIKRVDAPEATLAAAGTLERRSSRPVASVIADAFAGGDDSVEAFKSHANRIAGTVNGTEAVVSHPYLFDEYGWTLSEGLRDCAAEGVIALGDQPRPD